MKTKLLLIFIAAGAIAGCSLVVGSLDECTTDGDCASKGTGLACVDKLCVAASANTDAKCQSVYGNLSGTGVIRLGAIVSKTNAAGAADQRGVLREDALRLAVEQLNSKNALPGHTLVLRVCDDSGDATKAATQAGELLGEGATALVTTGSSETLAAAGVAVPRGAVVMSISASSTQIPSAGVLPDGGAKRVWSTAFSNADEGQVLASLLLDGGSIRGHSGAFTHPACIMRDDLSYTDLFNSVDNPLIQATDGGIALQRRIFSSSADIASSVSQAADLSPDAVLIIANTDDSAAIVQAWAGTGKADPIWFFTDNARNTSLYTSFDGGAARLAGNLGTGPSTSGLLTQEYRDFSDLFTNQFHVDPSTGSFVPNAYDSVLLLAAGALWASHSGSIDGAGIAQGLGQLSQSGASDVPLEPESFTTLQAAFSQGRKVNIKGASGPLDFDPATGVAPGAIDIWTIPADGGSIVTVRTVNP